MFANATTRTVLFSTALLLTAGAASADVFDDFTSADPAAGWHMELGTPGGTVTEIETKSETGLADVIGGSREWTFISNPYTYVYSSTFTTTGGNDAAVAPDYDYDGRQGVFNSNGDAMSGVMTFSVLYDNDGAGLGIDFSGAGVVVLDFYTDHYGYQVPTVISLTLADSNGSQTVAKSFPTQQIIGGWHTEAFDLIQYNSIDLTDLQSLQLTYSKDLLNDMMIDAIRTTGVVPEPASLSLLALGAAAMIRRRR